MAPLGRVFLALPVGGLLVAPAAAFAPASLAQVPHVRVSPAMSSSPAAARADGAASLATRASRVAIPALDVVSAYSQLARGQGSAAARGVLMPNLTSGVNVYDHGHFQVCTFGCLSDNIGFMIRPANGQATIAVDIPEASRYVEVAKELQWWPITHALLTHHHWDHAGGIPGLVAQQPDLKLYGGEVERPNLIKYTEQAPCNGDHDKYWVSPFLRPEDTFEIAGLGFRVYHVPGHTNGHIAFHMEEARTVFTGDVLFAMGCGRAFEGTPQELCSSLDTLRRKCGPETIVYCAHEYTLSNGKFACSAMGVGGPGAAASGEADSEKAVLAERVKLVGDFRSLGLPTVPSLMELEHRTNPFYVVPGQGPDRERRFAEVRAAKDRF